MEAIQKTLEILIQILPIVRSRSSVYSSSPVLPGPPVRLAKQVEVNVVAQGSEHHRWRFPGQLLYP